MRIKNNLSLPAKIIWSILLVYSGIVAIHCTFSRHYNEFFTTFSGKQTYYSYFTTQSNIIVGIVFFIAAISMYAPRVKKMFLKPIVLKASILYITLASLVYWVLLVPISGHVNTSLNNLWQHGFAMIIIWLYYLRHYPNDQKQRLTEFLRSKETYLVLIYPIVYLIYAMSLGQTNSRYIYPILNPYKMGGEAVVYLTIVGISLFTIFMYYLISKAKSKRM